ncbi:MAG: SWF/SNF helicase family protein, partial [Candidatus Schekmanbacteria bacterium]|nr:SWF/SNF helicase family protein [Candidatus Schekmanbacteria bacterium]
DGTWRVITRDETKRIFREQAAEVLLCTDAAAEGLNFQFRGALVNYSMPWNPMKGEQRIGRIDRLGLFNQFVGKPQPILSAVANRITAATLAPLEHRDQVRAGLVSGLAEPDSFAAVFRCGASLPRTIARPGEGAGRRRAVPSSRLLRPPHSLGTVLAQRHDRGG